MTEKSSAGGRGEVGAGEGHGGDLLLMRLEELVRAAADVDRAVDMLTARAADMTRARRQGASWREVVEGEERPLIAEMLTDTIQRFEAAGTRFRRAKARTLYDEGMTMEQIAEMFGLTRQRISVLLRDTAATAPDRQD